MEQPAGLAQHADTPSAQVQTLRASRSMRARWGCPHAALNPARKRRETRAHGVLARIRYWRARLSLAALCYQLPRPRDSMCAARASNPRRAGQSTHPAIAWHLSESTAPVLFLSSCVLSSGTKQRRATLNLASYKRCNLNLQRRGWRWWLCTIVLRLTGDKH